jgi:phenylacetate-CoA ligase
MRIEETEPHYQIVVDRGSTNLDEIEVDVEVEESFFSDTTKDLESLKAKIEAEIRSDLGIGAKVKLVEPKTIERSLGKAQRVIDKRAL